jgi:hypothetical protein
MPQGDSPSEARRLIYEATLPYIDADRRFNELLTSRPDARAEIAWADQVRHRAWMHLARRYRKAAHAAECGATEADARALRTIDQLCVRYLNPPRPADFPGLEGNLTFLLEAVASQSSRDELTDTDRKFLRTLARL